MQNVIEAILIAGLEFEVISTEYEGEIKIIYPHGVSVVVDNCQRIHIPSLITGYNKNYSILASKKLSYPVVASKYKQDNTVTGVGYSIFFNLKTGDLMHTVSAFDLESVIDNTRGLLKRYKRLELEDATRRYL